MRCALLDPDPHSLLDAIHLVRDQGHDCHRFDDVQTFKEAFLRETYDLAVLAWPACERDLLHWLRHDHDIKIPLLVIADLAQEAQVIQALQSGADEFLCRPLRAREFAARLFALLRGQYQYQNEASRALGAWSVHPALRMVRYQGIPILLTACEYALAKLFFANHGRVLSYAHITEELRRSGTKITLRSLRTHISRLRLKLHLSKVSGLRLAAISKIGYRLESTTEAVRRLPPAERA